LFALFDPTGIVYVTIFHQFLIYNLNTKQ
jgi:hypothetical protein